MKSGLVILIWTATYLSCASARAQDTPPAPESKQEVNRNTTPVDAAVHADIDVRAKKPPQLLPQEPNKRPTATTYSRWGFQSPNQPPATPFSPANATTPTGIGSSSDNKNASTLGSPFFRPNLQPPRSVVWPTRLADFPNAVANDANSQKVSGESGRLGSSLRDHTLRGSTVPQSSKITVPSLSYLQQPQTDGFSSPFPERQLGATGGENNGSTLSSLPNPFPKKSPPAGQARSKVEQHKHHPQKPKPGITPAIPKDSQDTVKP
jgi:hypothetical protein